MEGNKIQQNDTQSFFYEDWNLIGIPPLQHRESQNNNQQNRKVEIPKNPLQILEELSRRDLSTPHIREKGKIIPQKHSINEESTPVKNNKKRPNGLKKGKIDETFSTSNKNRIDKSTTPISNKNIFIDMSNDPAPERVDQIQNHAESNLLEFLRDEGLDYLYNNTNFDPKFLENIQSKRDLGFFLLFNQVESKTKHSIN
jgi:hypothetical protein